MDSRVFRSGTIVEDSDRHIGKVTAIYIAQNKVRVKWHKGYSSTEHISKLRIVE